jgi:hypothetical protein
VTPYLVALHVTLMFAATALAQGPAFLLWRAMRRGDVLAMRGVVDMFQGAGVLVGPLYGLGVVVGLIAVFVGGFDPFAPWLLIAYVLTIIAFVTPQLVTVPRMIRVGAAAHDSPVDAPSPELRTAISHATTPVFWVDAVLIVLFIIDMVVKPFS